MKNYFICFAYCFQVGGPSCVSSLSAAVAVGVGINYSINEARLEIADQIGDQRRWHGQGGEGRQLLALRSH